jgi:Protein of unknown function (DUF1569)
MAVKDLFDPTVKADIINRINWLTPQSQVVWGKMNVAQMLTHCQRPLGVGLGTHEIKGSFFMRLIGPLFKPLMTNNKPFKRGIATDKSFIVADQRNFEAEKQKLVDMVNRFAPDTLVDEPHPIFGKMTKEEWSKGTWKHLDHHLQQFGV